MYFSDDYSIKVLFLSCLNYFRPGFSLTRSWNGFEEVFLLKSFRSKVPCRRVIKWLIYTIFSVVDGRSNELIDKLRRLAQYGSSDFDFSVYDYVYFFDQNLSETFSSELVSKFYHELDRKFGPRLRIVSHPKMKQKKGMICGISALEKILDPKRKKVLYMTVYSTAIIDEVVMSDKAKDILFILPSLGCMDSHDLYNHETLGVAFEKYSLPYICI